MQNDFHPDHAADAFYAQPDASFAAQIAQICRNDSRLIAQFERVRAQYLENRHKGCVFH